MPTLVSPQSWVFPVQLVNISQEDVWLPPKVRLVLLTHCQCAESDVCEVRFQSISADHEEVKIDQRDKPMSDSDPSNLLSRLHIGGTPEQQAKLGVLLMKHADVFAVRDEDLGYTDWVKHEIHLTDDAPINKPYRRIPLSREMRSRTQMQRKIRVLIIKWNKWTTKTTPKGKNKQAGRQKTGAQSTWNSHETHERQRISTGLQTQGDYIGRQTRVTRETQLEPLKQWLSNKMGGDRQSTWEHMAPTNNKPCAQHTETSGGQPGHTSRTVT